MKTISKKSQTKTSQSKGKQGGKKETASTTENNMQGSKLMELFHNELMGIYWAEKALVKALPKMAKNATSEELVEAIENHLEETEGQVEKVEEVFELIEKKAKVKKCEGMAGLIREGEEIMKSSDKGSMRDAGIIAAAQKVEHFEIATYGTLRTYAEILGLEDVAAVLEEILDEEKATDEKLTEIAETTINIQAAEEGEEEEEEEMEEVI